jgi:hypothetical protein
MSLLTRMQEKAFWEELTEKNMAMFNHLINTGFNLSSGLSRYAMDFVVPYLISINYFTGIEKDKILKESPVETFLTYMDLLRFNVGIFERGVQGSVKMMTEFGRMESDRYLSALYNTLYASNGNDLEAFFARQAGLVDLLANEYPRSIENIEPEFGFHFERDNTVKVEETDRFILYQVLPLNSKVSVRQNAKPVIILPPFVLGANILAFLPGENKSYAHCFANQGIPTYIRILKDIETTPALQIMTGEDDVRDTRKFCEVVKQRHGKSVTLNGYCQGGFTAVCNLLSGELDGLVDALITCVAPMDGTRSKELAGFLKNLPERFNDLEYGTKTLPNGNKVADGQLMGWVYKLKSIDKESPLAVYFRDLIMFARQEKTEVSISKTAAALNYWLSHERYDLPLEITKMSFASYNTPITEDGTLPVKLFNRKLNLKRIKAKKIPWLICYGEHDDLVEKETALAPIDYVEAEVTGFPKGHVAIATSWSHPESACALHTRFGEQNYRGPVRFQLDIDQTLDNKKAESTKKQKPGRKTRNTKAE